MIWNNGKIHDGSLEAHPEASAQGWIYEVIRVIDACPVFLPEHLGRYREAGKATDIPFIYSDTELIRGFFDIIELNKQQEGNIRLQTGLTDGNTLIGFIPHRYPSEEDYINGVGVSLVYLSRTNPTVKTWNRTVRTTADRIIREKNVYEVILTSPQGFLLEGSRSNIFGFKKDMLITPPQENVLPGITRKIVISLAEKNYLPVFEKPIHKSELPDFQSFFLTGTSPGILPVSNIDSYRFSCISSPCSLLRNAYREKIIQSIRDIKPKT